MKKIILSLLAVLGLTSACGQKHYEDADVSGFAELIAQPGVVLLDVRTAEEFNEGHLAGSLNVDVKQSDFLAKAKAAIERAQSQDSPESETREQAPEAASAAQPTEKTVAVYCRSGRRSADAANKLSAEGYKLVNLKGGILAWKAANMPVTQK